MTGEYQHTLDAKGRLFIPAKLREKLGNPFYITISIDDCLNAYSLDHWNAIKAKFDALPSAQARRMRQIFVNAACCEVDAQGRILIPQKLRDFVGLKKNVTIVGVSNHAEIWDSEKWAAQQAVELTKENIAAAIEELGF